MYDLEGRTIAPLDDLHRLWMVEMEILPPEAIVRSEEATDFLNGSADNNMGACDE